MAGVEVENHRELHLDHRHLTFFFIGAVVVCAIFFALGFIVGRGQAYEASIKASTVTPEASAPKPESELSPQPGQKTGPSVDDSPGLSKQVATLDSTGVKPNEGETDFRKELDFYSAVKDQKVNENFNPSGQKVKDPAASAAQRPAQSPSTPVSLQVAALTSVQDVETLAAKLRSGGYPVFVVRPGSGSPDKFIRIQVGPFDSRAQAASVKAKLEQEGYKPIFKR